MEGGGDYDEALVHREQTNIGSRDKASGKKEIKGNVNESVVVLWNPEDEKGAGKSISLLSEDYFERLRYGGNIFTKDKVVSTARRVANNYMWTIIKFIAKNDTDIVLHNGQLCRLVLQYTCKSDGYFREFLLTEENRVFYWKVAQKILRNALFRKRSAVSTSIKNKFFSKWVCCLCGEI